MGKSLVATQEDSVGARGIKRRATHSQMGLEPFLQRLLAEISHACCENQTVASDQRRVGQNALRISKMQGNIQRIVGRIDQDRIRNGILLEKSEGVGRWLGGHANDFDAFGGVARAHGIEHRHFFATRPTPARPEVQDDELAVPFGQTAWLSVTVGKADVINALANTEPTATGGNGNHGWRRPQQQAQPEPHPGTRDGQQDDQ